MIGRRNFLTTTAAAAWAGGARSAPRPSAPSDLTGVWTNAWYTTLERRKAFTALVVTLAEAEAFEAPRRARNGELISDKDKLGQDETEFPDNGPGLARIDRQIRSSWIVDPPDGKIPWTKAARDRIHPDPPAPDDFDNVEARDTDERCLTAAGPGGRKELTSAGPLSFAGT